MEDARSFAMERTCGWFHLQLHWIQVQINGFHNVVFPGERERIVKYASIGIFFQICIAITGNNNALVSAAQTFTLISVRYWIELLHFWVSTTIISCCLDPSLPRCWRVSLFYRQITLFTLLYSTFASIVRHQSDPLNAIFYPNDSHCHQLDWRWYRERDAFWIKKTNKCIK